MSKISVYPLMTAPVPTLRLIGTDTANFTEDTTGTTETITVSTLLSTVYPSGDTSGTNDGLSVGNAFANGAKAVALAPGQWYQKAPWTVPAGCRLTGQLQDNWGTGGAGAVVNITTGWAQGAAPLAAAIIMGGNASSADTFAIDFGYPSGSIDGVSGSGSYVGLRDLDIYNGPGNGVTCNGTGWYARKVQVANAYSYAFNKIGTDSDYTDCIAASAQVAGWNLVNPINSRLINPRAEYCQLGYSITGNNTATGGVTITNATTDRNVTNAVYISSTGYWPVIINGMNLRRDASNGTSAALSIAASNLSPVIIDGLAVFPGYFDDGSGTQSPVTGVSIGSGCRYVAINGAYVHAVTTPFSGSAPNSGRAIATATGSWNGPSSVTFITDTA
jgi:hypothetical protein